MGLLGDCLGEVISTHSLTRRLTEHFPERTQGICISTHSLTRRLTALFNSCRKAFHISTHSLTRRLTERIQDQDISVAFQLTASRGG